MRLEVVVGREHLCSYKLLLEDIHEIQQVLRIAVSYVVYECQLESEPRARLILSHLCSFEKCKLH